MKTVHIHATFPELSAAHAEQSAKGEGSTLKVAITRAVANLLTKPHVKGRRIKAATLRVIVQENSSLENFGDSPDS